MGMPAGPPPRRRRRRSSRAKPVVSVRTDGVLDNHVRKLNEQVFQSAIDEHAWAERLGGGKLLTQQCTGEDAVVRRRPRSWVLTTENTFLVAHERDEMVNVWLAGSKQNAQGKGEFKLVVRKLLSQLPLTATISATTYPKRFPKMYGILSLVATRCDRPEDLAEGKARFSMRAWQLHIFMNRRAYLRKAKKVATGLLAAAALAGIFFSRPRSGLLTF